MKIGVVCPTYKRPRLLGRAIFCFTQQTHRDCELLIVDDAQQFDNQEGDRWRLVSVPQRFPNLGAKRQFGVNMLSPDCEAYMIFDDDDCYWPHAVASVSRALEATGAAWAQCRHVYESSGDKLVTTRAFGRGVRDWGYGGCWAYRLDALRAVGGYADAPGADDLRLAYRVHARFGESADSTAGVAPWYWYSREPGVAKVSDEGPGFWEKRAGYSTEEQPELAIGWNGPNIYERAVLPGIQRRPW